MSEHCKKCSRAFMAWQWQKPAFLLMKFPDTERGEILIELVFKRQNKSISKIWLPITADKCRKEDIEGCRKVIYQFPKKQNEFAIRI